MPGNRVLIIEDDEASQYVYGTVLQHRGYDVRQARTAQEGLRMVREEHPDLVVMDIGLPEIDGFELTRRIKANPATTHIPVIAVTVHTFDEDRAAAVAAGCDVFFAKPLQPTELAHEIERVLASLGTSP